jgi:hypothetical protein
MPDAPEGEWLDQLLDYGNGFNDQVAKALRNGVTLSDNTPYKTQSYILKHGVETEITPPLAKGLSIKGVSVLQCEGIEVDATTLKPTGKVTSLGLGSPLVWRPSGKESGSIYVTANYDLRHTAASLSMYLSGNTVGKANASDAIVTEWDTVERADTTGTITHAAGVFTCAEAGNYLVSADLRWQSGTYTGAQLTIKKNAASQFYSSLALAFTTLPIINASFPVSLAAGGNVSIFAYQSNAAAAARTMTGSTEGCRVAVSRLYNDSTPFGRLNLLFYGE